MSASRYPQTVGSGVQAKPPRGRDIKADVRRFTPCETTKRVVVAQWFDADTLARVLIEGAQWPGHDQPVNTGYPTA